MLQENQWCHTALLFTIADQGFSWGEHLPVSREPNHAEDGTWEVCFCPLSVQEFSRLQQSCCSPWHQAESSPLLLTALVRTLASTTQQGLALRPRLQGFRKQMDSEKSHIKIQGSGKYPWDWPSEEPDPCSSC